MFEFIFVIVMSAVTVGYVFLNEWLNEEVIRYYEEVG